MRLFEVSGRRLEITKIKIYQKIPGRPAAIISRYILAVGKGHFVARVFEYLHRKNNIKIIHGKNNNKFNTEGPTLLFEIISCSESKHAATVKLTITNQTCIRLGNHKHRHQAKGTLDTLQILDTLQ